MTTARDLLQAVMTRPGAGSDEEIAAAVDRLTRSDDPADFRALVDFFAFAIRAVHQAVTPNALDRAKRVRDYVASRLARHPSAAEDEAYREQRRRHETQRTARVPLEQFIAWSDGVIEEVQDAIAREGANPAGYPNATLVLATMKNWNRLAKSGDLPGSYSPASGLGRPDLTFGKLEDRLRALEDLYVSFFRDAKPDGAS